MRKRFEQQRKLGVISISEVKLPLKSRDELPPILRALQHIYATPELNEEVFRILEEKALEGKKKTRRYGMELWHILVLSVVRLGLDADYDRLEDFANHHKLSSRQQIKFTMRCFCLVEFDNSIRHEIYPERD